MHTAAKREFLAKLLEGPQTRPTGFAGGQPGWDHNVTYFTNRRIANVTYDEQGRYAVCSLTDGGRDYAIDELAKLPTRGRSRGRVLAFGEMTDAQQARIRAQWAAARAESDKMPK
jgi:hypothetical protein